MERCDGGLEATVLVVGAGPAGGDLSRRLAMAGVDVLLADQLSDLSRAAFSSAALPLEALHRFGLPASVVAQRWSRWQLHGPGDSLRQWSGSGPLGAVLDFGALRQWLAQQTSAWGGRVRLGLRALDCTPQGDGWLRTRLRDRDGRICQCRSRWVIDASGHGRALIGDPDGAEPLLSGVGVEWLLEVEQDCWQRWQDRISFCLGSDWIPQGYGWIFPMQPGVLKVGVCRFEEPARAQPPLAPFLQSLIERLVLPQGTGDCRGVLDRHGGRIRSTIRRREPHRRGRLIGLGDAVSTANLLGGEGIRHALSSSEVLAPLLIEAVRADTEQPLQAYPPMLRRALGPRWSLSGRVARRAWLRLQDCEADRQFDRLLTGLEDCSGEDISALFFDYRFERYGLRALPYLLGLR